MEGRGRCRGSSKRVREREKKEHSIPQRFHRRCRYQHHTPIINQLHLITVSTVPEPRHTAPQPVNITNPHRTELAQQALVVPGHCVRLGVLPIRVQPLVHVAHIAVHSVHLHALVPGHQPQVCDVLDKRSRSRERLGRDDGRQ